MLASRSVRLGLFVLLLAPACKGDGGDPVQGACEVIADCTCSIPPYADVNSCVTQVEADLEDTRMKAAELGLIYDEACIGPTLRILEEVGCRLASEVDFGAICNDCALVHGDKPKGSACTSYEGGHSDCARAYVCLSDVCTDPCERLAAGVACASDDGSGFNTLGTCAEGLYCDAVGTLTCTAKAGIGAECAALEACEDGLYCGADMTCVDVPGEGEACVGVCERGFVCDVDICRVGPALGEACAQGLCGPGLRCDAGSCRAEEPLLCLVGSDL